MTEPTLLYQLVSNLDLRHEVALLLIRAWRQLLLPELEESSLDLCSADDGDCICSGFSLLRLLGDLLLVLPYRMTV